MFSCFKGVLLIQAVNIEIISQLNKNINLTYKAPLVGSRSNRFWIDLKKFRE